MTLKLIPVIELR